MTCGGDKWLQRTTFVVFFLAFEFASYAHAQDNAPPVDEFTDVSSPEDKVKAANDPEVKAANKFAINPNQAEMKAARGTHAKVVGGKIACTVCEQAAATIAANMSKAYGSEDQILEEISGYCEWTKEGNSLSEYLSWRDWQVGPKPGNKKGDRWTWDFHMKNMNTDGQMQETEDVNTQKWAIDNACKASLGEHESEIAEWLYVQTQKIAAGKIKRLDGSDLKKLMCVELSGVCKKDKNKSKKSKKAEL